MKEWFSERFFTTALKKKSFSLQPAYNVTIIVDILGCGKIHLVGNVVQS